MVIFNDGVHEVLWGLSQTNEATANGYFQRRVLDGARYAFLNSFICLTNDWFAGIGVIRMIWNSRTF